ncbi:MAG: hypothetical protein FJ388_18160 [Verrucomicrobia bacterium]|nr:hypothetical protein [Verrucomicrobiota bacterium]
MNRFASFNAPATLAGGGAAALAMNAASVTAFCWNGLMLGAGALLAGALALGTEPGRRWLREHRDAMALLAFWLAPMVLIGTVVSFTRQPGFVLSYLPALLILAGAALAGLKHRAVFAGATAAVCAVNAVAFLAWPAAWDGVLFHVGRTAREIRQHDQRLGGLIETIRARYRPAETVVCHALEFYLFGMRLFAFYLPEFDHYQFEHDATLPYPEGRPLWLVRGGRTEFAAGLELAGKRHVLLVVPPGQSLKLFERQVPVSRARVVEGTDGMLYELPAEDIHP